MAARMLRITTIVAENCGDTNANGRSELHGPLTQVIAVVPDRDDKVVVSPIKRLGIGAE